MNFLHWKNRAMFQSIKLNLENPFVTFYTLNTYIYYEQ